VYCLNTRYLEDDGRTLANVGGVSETTYHLPGYKACSLDAKLPATHVEEILHTWAKKFDYKNIVKTFGAEVIDLGNADCSTALRTGRQMKQESETYGIRLEYDMNGTRLLVAALPTNISVKENTVSAG
jgi:hypothetical protein